jgi:agmatine/peptidylarginine deiminase
VSIILGVIALPDKIRRKICPFKVKTTQLVNNLLKEQNVVKQRKILQKIKKNLLLQFHCEISNDYIENFAVNGQGIETIVLPIFGVLGNKDNEVVNLFKTKIFPGRKIETINCNDIALQGGLLNCSTWTVFE